MQQYYIYILASRFRRLYVGVTNNLERHILEHKEKRIPGFTSRYNITRLLYFETTDGARTAIEREKQIKGWLRARKMALIESANPSWKDLSVELFGTRAYYQEEIQLLNLKRSIHSPGPVASTMVVGE